MTPLAVGIIAAVVGALLTWLATSLPTVRQSREYKRQLRQTIVGIPAAPGVEERPSLVTRVVGLETSINEVGVQVGEGVAAASAAAEQAITAAEALPRLEVSVEELKDSHDVLSATLHDHMKSEENAITQMREATKAHREETASQVQGLHVALAEHAELDLAVSAEIRTVANEATRHAEAARVAAENAAEAARVSAVLDQQVLAGTELTHKNLAAISTAVGAETPDPDPDPEIEPPPGRRRKRST